MNGTQTQRFFILTSGRSGSTLLATVLADAGADFGLSIPDTWDRTGGAMENRYVLRAAHHYRRAYDIDCGQRYVISPLMETRIRRHIARRNLKKALYSAVYHKINDLDLVIQPANKLGYSPVLILNYRRFEANMSSNIRGRTYTSPDQLEKDYLRIYRQGLALMHTFGGCLVSYADLVNPDDTSWANGLSAITGLDKNSIVQARNKRLSVDDEKQEYPVIYEDAYALYRQMEEIKYQVVENK